LNGGSEIADCFGCSGGMASAPHGCQVYLFECELQEEVFV
jgi:hypothetical protein